MRGIIHTQDCTCEILGTILRRVENVMTVSVEIRKAISTYDWSTQQVASNLQSTPHGGFYDNRKITAFKSLNGEEWYSGLSAAYFGFS